MPNSPSFFLFGKLTKKKLPLSLKPCRVLSSRKSRLWGECQSIEIFCLITCLGSTRSLLIILIFTCQLSAPIKWGEF